MRNKSRIAIVFGARPTFIKMSPLIKALKLKRANFFIIHTGQHYSKELNKVFFEELKIPKPDYNLKVGSGSQAYQTGLALIKIEKIFLKEKPDLVLVYGDTNAMLSGALGAAKLHLPLAHIEAGLRSYDRFMPEEINRVMADHLSDYLFAPTEIAKTNLLKEGVKKEKIFVVGNLIVDALFQNIKVTSKYLKLLKNLKIKKNNYFLITAHRPENVDVKEKLSGILEGLSLIYKTYNLPIIFPIHPRSEKMIKKFKLKIPEGIKLTKPVGYFEFLTLMKNAKLVLTDSGGVQEEGCILKIPCVTLRENTERPETIKVKSNVLVGTDPEKILKGVKTMIQHKKNWKNPFGDGKTSLKIIKILRKEGFLI
ncbi:MAG: non-hydrolyzing UDP-N-acetylglucosamine 2-epimerase [Minisyncoccia bacterium]